MHPTTNSPGFLPKHGSLGSRDDRPGTKPGVRRTPGVGTPGVKSGTPRVKSCIHTFLTCLKGLVLQKKELLAPVVPRLAAFFSKISTFPALAAHSKRCKPDLPGNGQGRRRAAIKALPW